jgi:hypothetical protein
VRQPKNSNEAATEAPLARCAARSCKKPRNGASPVPAPIMIIGNCGSSGGRKAIVGSRTKANTVLFGALDSK